MTDLTLPDAIHEWWIHEPYTWLGGRLVGTVYGSTTGHIRAIEWTPDLGVTVDQVVATSSFVDDHNAPGHWAAPGERAVVVWQQHNADSLLRVQVSQPGPDMASLADAPIHQIDVGAPVSYGSPRRIVNLSDDTQHTFWCPIRTGDMTEWRIATFSVDRRNGAVAPGETLHFAGSDGGQFYGSFAEARNAAGSQVLRVAMYHNPAAAPNLIWYLEIDCVTGDVTSPADPALAGNVLTAGSTGRIELRGGSNSSPAVVPVLPHSDDIGRRMFYCAAGPWHRRIAYAEWPAGLPDRATYKVLDLDTGITTDYGAAGSRFGYTPEANYLPGMCFDTPAHDDTVYLARNPAGGPATLERHWTQRGVATHAVLRSSETTVLTRPIAPAGGGPVLLYFDQTDYGRRGTFIAEGQTRAASKFPATSSSHL